TRDGAAAVEDMLRERSGPGWPETDDFAASAELLRRAMLIPKVAHLSLESRRWMVRSQFRPDGRDFRRAVSRVLDQPVLGISGAEDRYIHPATVAASAAWARDLRTAHVPGAGHYPAMEAPGATSELIVRFARGVSGRWTDRTPPARPPRGATRCGRSCPWTPGRTNPPRPAAAASPAPR